MLAPPIVQRISLTLPHGHGLAAIPFVIRSEDGERGSLRDHGDPWLSSRVRYTSPDSNLPIQPCCAQPSLPESQPLPAPLRPRARPAGNQWWRDGGSDFTVPVPGARAKKEKDNALGFEDELRLACS